MRKSLRYMGLLAALLMFVLVPAGAHAAASASDLSSKRLAAYQWEGFTAESWAKSTAYGTVGVRIVNGAAVYQVITAGTSENTDNAGPKGTSQDITDGTVHWKWLGTTTSLGIDNSASAGEAALASPVVDATGLDSVTVVAGATGTSSDRVLTISCMAADKTTILYSFATVAVGANAKALVLVRADVTVPGTWNAGTFTGVPPTGVTYINVTPCPRIKASMPAISAGAGITATLAVYGRKLPDYLSKPIRFQYESGSVTAGAALSSGVINTTGLDSLQVIVEATTTSRALVVSCMSKDGEVSLFDYASLTVTSGAKFLRTFRTDSPTPGTEVTNVLHIPVDLCPRMKASIAAAGVASAKLAVYGR